MNIAELKMKLEAIAEELGTIQQEAAIEEDAVEETVEVVDEETVEEQEPSALDIAKMDPETRMQYFLAKKRMQPDTRSRDEKAADMATAQAKIAAQKASFDDEPKDVYGDMMANRLKKMQQRKAYQDAAAGMGMSTRPSKFSFEDEQVEEAEVAVDETVAVPVQELADLLQLAGYEDYEQKIEEYANEPNEEYQDAEDQMIGLSGGLNGPKKMHAPAAGGDNPMEKEPLKVEEGIDAVEAQIYKSYAQYLEEADATEE